MSNAEIANFSLECNPKLWGFIVPGGTQPNEHAKLIGCFRAPLCLSLSKCECLRLIRVAHFHLYIPGCCPAFLIANKNVVVREILR